MALIVADTDVLIDYLAGVEPMAGRVADALAAGRLCTTAVSRAELLRGVRTARQVRATAELLAAVVTLPLDEDGADRAAEVARGLDRAGQTIGMADALIAGIVLAHGGALLTRNRDHFVRVPGLDLAEAGDE